MNKKEENNVYLDWNFDGFFEALISNGKIAKVTFCEPGKGPEDVGYCLTCIESKHLRHVYQALGELFKEEENQQKKLGHKFATDTEEIKDEKE